jgi:hypothetical protein
MKTQHQHYAIFGWKRSCSRKRSILGTYAKQMAHELQWNRITYVWVVSNRHVQFQQNHLQHICLKQFYHTHHKMSPLYELITHFVGIRHPDLVTMSSSHFKCSAPQTVSWFSWCCYSGIRSIIVGFPDVSNRQWSGEPRRMTGQRRKRKYIFRVRVTSSRLAGKVGEVIRNVWLTSNPSRYPF